MKELKTLKIGKDIKLNFLSKEEELNKKDIKKIEKYINSKEVLK
jgi:hypothetical protein